MRLSQGKTPRHILWAVVISNFVHPVCFFVFVHKYVVTTHMHDNTNLWLKLIQIWPPQDASWRFPFDNFTAKRCRSQLRSRYNILVNKLHHASVQAKECPLERESTTLVPLKEGGNLNVNFKNFLSLSFRQFTWADLEVEILLFRKQKTLLRSVSRIYTIITQLFMHRMCNKSCL